MSTMWETHRDAIFAYITFFAVGLGSGLVAPVLPLYAQRLGASDALVGVIVSCGSLGTVVWSIPAARVITNMGYLFSMYVGMAMMSFVAIGSGSATRPWQLVFTQTFSGAGWQMVTLAGQIYIKREIDESVRGTVMGTYGGMQRLSKLVSPYIGGVMAERISIRFPFFMRSAVMLIIIPVTYFLEKALKPPQQNENTDIESFIKTGNDDDGRQGLQAPDSKPLSSPSMENKKARGKRVTGWWPVLTAAVLAFIISLLRGGLKIIIPLKGEDLGMSEEEIGLAVSVSTVFSALFFPLSGYLSDKFGRKVPAGTSCIIMGAGFGVLSLCTPSLKSAFTAKILLYVGSIIVGIGDGASAGIVMTMGADLAPYDLKSASNFIAKWRMISQSGGFVAPLLVGIVTQFADISLSTWLLCFSGILGILWVIFILVETKETLISDDETLVDSEMSKFSATQSLLLDYDDEDEDHENLSDHSDTENQLVEGMFLD